MTTEVKADEEGLVQMKAIVLKIQSVRFYYNYNYTKEEIQLVTELLLTTT